MSVTAKVEMTVMVSCGSNWSDDTTMNQIRKQAVEDAEGAIRRLFQESPQAMQVLGELKVVGVVVKCDTPSSGRGKP